MAKEALRTAVAEIVNGTRAAPAHSTYHALAELGKAIKTIFLFRYLHEESLRLENHKGLNVVENWNSANNFIFYGEKGEIATNRIEDQELTMLSLHLLQACLVDVNTLFIQEALSTSLNACFRHFPCNPAGGSRMTKLSCWEACQILHQCFPSAE